MVDKLSILPNCEKMSNYINFYLPGLNYYGYFSANANSLCRGSVSSQAKCNSLFSDYTECSI